MKLLHYSESVGKGAARFVHHAIKNLVNAALPNNSLLEIWINPVSNRKTLVENAFGFTKDLEEDLIARKTLPPCRAWRRLPRIGYSNAINSKLTYVSHISENKWIEVGTETM